MALRAQIVFEPVRPAGTALTWCVHRPVAWPHGIPTDRRTLHNASRYDPPRPGPVSGNGYAVLEITDAEDLYRFTSAPEIDEFTRVMALQVLPDADALAARYGMSAKSRIWISRVAKRQYDRRRALVAFVRSHDAGFRRLVGR